MFGRNTIGGAINITARKPGDELSGQLAVTAGNFDRRDIRASLDLPISEYLRGALAVSEKNRDGFVDRVLVGDKLGDEDEFAFRGVVLFEPSDSLDFQLTVDRTEIDEQSAGSTLPYANPASDASTSTSKTTCTTRIYPTNRLRMRCISQFATCISYSMMRLRRSTQ